MSLLAVGVFVTISVLAEVPVQQVGSDKKSRFLETGVFVGGYSQSELALLDIRHSMSKPAKIERIVLDIGDIKTGKPVDRPGFFHVAIQKNPKRIVVDLENVEEAKITSQAFTQLLKKSPYFSKVNYFFDTRSKNLTIEISVKAPVEVEVFELVNEKMPGRIVVDAKSP